MTRPINTLHNLPNACYTARKIRELCRFVDANKAIRIHQVSLTVVHNMLLTSLRYKLSFPEDGVFDTEDSSCFCCFSVFHHIYMLNYREPDFASFDNLLTCYINFQHLLWEISAAYRRHGSWIREKLPHLRLFDVKKMADNAACMKRWNYEWQ